MALSSYSLANLLFVAPLGKAKKTQFPHPEVVPALLAGGFLSQEPRSWFYYITDAGRAALMAGDEAPVAVAPAAPVLTVMPPPVVLGAVTAPIVTMSELQDDPLYASDAYLRSIAVASVECWGGWAKGDAACGACPLAASCRSQRMVRVAQSLKALEIREKDELEKKLREEREQKELAAKKALEEEEKMKAKASSLIDEILGEAKPATAPPAPAAAPAPAPAPAAPKPAPSPTAVVVSGAKDLVVPFAGVCSACKGKIGVGETGKWVAGKGLFHPTCVTEV